jgi:acetyl esterase/lipase
MTMSGSTLASKDAVDPLIHKDYLGELADAYLPAGMNRKDPRVSPLYADLKGFPPTLIQVGSAETLLADATRRSRGRRSRCASDAGDLAAHDSRLAAMECAAGARPPRACQRGCVHARVCVRLADPFSYIRLERREPRDGPDT